MPDLYGSHFEFGGVSSRTHGLMIASIESAQNTQSAGAISGINVFNKKHKRNYLVGDDYSTFPLSFDIEIMTDDDSVISRDNRRAIENWLFNRHNFQKLYLDADDDCDGETSEEIDGVTKRLFLNCRFINPNYLYYQGGIVGYRATLETDTGMWWQDSITKVFYCTHTTDTDTTAFTLNVDTDIDDYTYPRIRVTMNGNGGTFTMINSTDDDSRMTTFTGLSAGAVFTVDSELNYVSGNYYEQFYHQRFPRLLRGTNELLLRGNVAIVELVYSNRRSL